MIGTIFMQTCYKLYGWLYFGGI